MKTTKLKTVKFKISWKNAKGEAKSYTTPDQRKAYKKLFMLRHKTSTATNIRKSSTILG